MQGKVCRPTVSIIDDSVLVGKPEGRRPLGRPRRRWEDKIKMDHQEAGFEDGVDRFGSG
jgi:hypothetical protein